MSVTHRILSAAAFPFLLSALAAIGCYASAGASLGLVLGALFLLTLIVPPVAAAERLSANRLIALSAALLPMWVAWALAASRTETRFAEWRECAEILTGYAIALAGLAVGFRMLRWSAAVSAALAVVIGLAWMTWPVWLSPTWDGEASAPGVARLVACHPGMAANGVLFRQFSPWSEQSVAYHLTDLSQDVPYALPDSPWPCTLLHAILGAALLALAAWAEARRPRVEAEAGGHAVIAQPS
jgi:hypothetical protein